MHSNNQQLAVSITGTLKCPKMEDKLGTTDNFILHGAI